jgi:hypothetical protein
LVFAALLFDIPANLCIRLLLSPFYYIVSALAMIAGYALWEMKRWGWYVFVVANFFIAYGNALLANDYSASHHQVLAFIASIVTIAAIGYRIGKEIRVPYFFPKIRWWESNPRYKLAAPVKLTLKSSGHDLEGDILDISMGGCFIKLRSEVAQDEAIQLHFSVFQTFIEATGTVVWRTQSTVTHPKGVGIKFHGLTRTNRRHLRQVCTKLKKVANFYRRSRYLMNQEDFMKQLDQLETTLKTKG